jgi:hypothetical protein
MPSLDLTWRLLVDLRYGLLAFGPVLLAAFAAPFVRKSPKWKPWRAEYGWMFAAFVALLVFISANQFAYLQWNTGVRYMVPAVPLLFIIGVPALEAMPRAVRWSLVSASLVITLAVSMTREDIPTALRMTMNDGPTLPVLLVLRKMSSGYDVTLPPWTFGVIAMVITAILILLWRPVWRRARPA